MQGTWYAEHIHFKENQQKEREREKFEINGAKP